MLTANPPQPVNDDAALHASLWYGLAALGKPTTAAAGAVLFREGEPVRGLFLLSRGKVRLSLSKNRKSITYRVVEPRYVLGLPATLTQRPYSLTAEIVEDAEFLFVDAATAMTYLRDHADICMHVLEFLSHEMVWIRHVHAAQINER